MYGEELWSQWKRVNAIVLSWLMNSVSKNLLSRLAFASSAMDVWTDLQERFDRVNGSRTYSLHKEIATLQQGTTSVSAYYTKLKALWDEFEVLVPAPCYNCEKSRGFIVHMNRQRLYQFLMWLNDSYHQARSQILMIDPLPTVNQAYAMVVGDESQKSVITGINTLGQNASILESAAMYSKGVISSGASVEATLRNTVIKLLDIHQTLSQRERYKVSQIPVSILLMLISLMSQARVTASDDNKANAAGKTLFVTENSNVWIVDTGATNHMVSNLDMLKKESMLKLDIPKEELYTGKVKEVGKKEGDLYLLWRQLSQSTSKESALVVDSTHPTDKDSTTEVKLWHQRLGHVSSTKSDICISLPIFLKYVQNQFGKTVKAIRTDNGTEFVNSVCDHLFKELGVIHQKSLNGVVERKHRHLLEVTRALRFQVLLLPFTPPSALQLHRAFTSPSALQLHRAVTPPSASPLHAAFTFTASHRH
ncbi:uncharacterized protein LOC129894386 [Solanum dulcamara]|uniref:uncharacterized protein LOC129894386 n=1 Tax=Solanum dulcamara TaxID=45834 RepID=UPI0024856760|nr:uncharacterized protein LOC129894386 [Solanum dulcamara]